MNAELIEKIKEYVAECSYDPSGQMIWTKERKHLCDIRGWGHLQNKFSTEDEAAIFQDGIGKFIEDAINEKVLRVAESNTWVKVEDRLPEFIEGKEYSDDVLVMYNDEPVVAYLSGLNKWVSQEENVFFYEDSQITLWLPIPPLPTPPTK